MSIGLTCFLSYNVITPLVERYILHCDISTSVVYFIQHIDFLISRIVFLKMMLKVEKGKLDQYSLYVAITYKIIGKVSYFLTYTTDSFCFIIPL